MRRARLDQWGVRAPRARGSDQWGLWALDGDHAGEQSVAWAKSLVVRTDEHFYEVRYRTKEENEDEGLMDRLAQTVEVD